MKKRAIAMLIRNDFHKSGAGVIEEEKVTS